MISIQKKKNRMKRKRRHNCITTGLSDWACESMLLYSRTKTAPGRHRVEREIGAVY